MTDYTTSRLEVYGPEDKVKAFIESNRGAGMDALLFNTSEDNYAYPLDLSKSVPTPSNFNSFSDEERQKWVDENWSVDYLESSGDWEAYGKGMKLSFAAPYMPPDAWIRKIGPLYPELTFVLTSTIDSSYSIYNRYEVSGDSLKYSQSYMGYTLLRAGTAYLIERSMNRFETPQERKAWVMKWLLFPLMPWSSKIVKFDDEENDPIYYEVGGKD